MFNTLSKNLTNILEKLTKKGIVTEADVNNTLREVRISLLEADVALEVVKDLIEKKISLPAYDQCLKSSHIFNLLDARGVISVAQRAEYIARIRDLTKEIGKIWIESQS